MCPILDSDILTKCELESNADIVGDADVANAPNLVLFEQCDPIGFVCYLKCLFYSIYEIDFGILVIHF